MVDCTQRKTLRMSAKIIAELDYSCPTLPKADISAPGFLKACLVLFDSCWKSCKESSAERFVTA